MNIKVTADSTCDLSPALIGESGIALAPLIVIKDGREHRDGVDIAPSDVFEHVRRGGALCTTAAPNVEIYRTLFQEQLRTHDAVVHLSIGSEFSSSHPNACLAAAEFDTVRVIDTRNVSTGQGLVALKAVELAGEGMEPDALCKALDEYAARVETSFVIDRLDYMAKGGRCSAIQLLGANLLSLKPCIEVQKGKLQVVKKYHGSLERCLRQYLRERLERRTDIDRSRAFITHTPMPEEALRAARETVMKLGGFDRVDETEAGCTISCHCGPGTLGVMFARKG
ncbi:MAG: DegV family protein [Clostridiales bacterium]|nr:DegV family protein [Clostridiales bacterium]